MSIAALLLFFHKDAVVTNILFYDLTFVNVIKQEFSKFWKYFRKNILLI